MLRESVFDLWSGRAMAPSLFFYRLPYSRVQNLCYMTDANNTIHVLLRLTRNLTTSGTKQIIRLNYFKNWLLINKQ